MLLFCVSKKTQNPKTNPNKNMDEKKEGDGEEEGSHTRFFGTLPTGQGNDRRGPRGSGLYSSLPWHH